MNREELAEKLHDLTGELMSLETNARELGEGGVAEHLEVARSFLVAAAGRMEPPLR
ncbi:MAG: hypothetical protein V3U31_00240 [Dehalococcoidia bacterium]